MVKGGLELDKAPAMVVVHDASYPVHTILTRPPHHPPTSHPCKLGLVSRFVQNPRVWTPHDGLIIELEIRCPSWWGRVEIGHEKTMIRIHPLIRLSNIQIVK